MSIEPRTRSSAPAASRPAPANLADILERVLDRGLVIAGDIRISLLDIELLTVKLRLLIASVDTARQLGIDWWEHDPWLTSRASSAVDGDKKSLRGRDREAIGGRGREATALNASAEEEAPRRRHRESAYDEAREHG